MAKNSWFWLFFIFSSCIQFSNWVLASPSHLTDRFHLKPLSISSSEPQEYLDPTFPSLLLPTGPPSCSVPVLKYDFAYTYGSPPAAGEYTPPPACPYPWRRVVLDLSVACAGEQYDRIAAVWVDGAEVLRTSTAEPTAAGVFWRVRKDVTHYSALLRRPSGAVVSMMLENIVNDVFTGVYHVNVSLDFYQKEEEGELGTGDLASAFESDETHLAFPPDSIESSWNKELGVSQKRSLGEFIRPIGERLDSSSAGAGNPIRSMAKVTPLNGGPADLIIPISKDNNESGFWFRIQNQADVHLKSFEIPANTYRAVLEVYVSFHGNDEFWYSNPPNSYIKENNLTTERGNATFREVTASIDGRVVGSIVPFPVIFTGGINPLFWSPVVALGAFDLPSYNVELTPFLGLLLDGQPHNLSLGVTDSIAFWLVDASLHLWLDPSSASVQAELVAYKAPELSVSRRYLSYHLNGTFKTDAKRKFHFSGWVNSSLGNLTTDVDSKQKFKSLVLFTNDGNYKEVRMKGKVKTDVRIRDGPKAILAQETYKSKYPLLIASATLPGENGTVTMRTNLSHTLYVEKTHAAGKVVTTTALVDKQDAAGWMLVQGHSVLSGSAATTQTYQYRNSSGIYLRKVSARDGSIVDDETTRSLAVASL